MSRSILTLASSRFTRANSCSTTVTGFFPWPTEPQNRASLACKGEANAEGWTLGYREFFEALPAVRPYSVMRRTASSRSSLEYLPYGTFDMGHLLFMLS